MRRFWLQLHTTGEECLEEISTKLKLEIDLDVHTNFISYFRYFDLFSTD